MGERDSDGSNSAVLLYRHEQAIKRVTAFFDDWEKEHGYRDLLRDLKDQDFHAIATYVSQLKSTPVLEKAARMEKIFDLLDGPKDAPEKGLFTELFWLRDRKETIARDDLVMVKKAEWVSMQRFMWAGNSLWVIFGGAIMAWLMGFIK